MKLKGNEKSLHLFLISLLVRTIGLEKATILVNCNKIKLNANKLEMEYMIA